MSFSISLPNHRKKIFFHASPFPEIKFSSSEGSKKAFLIIIRTFKENKKINGRIKMRKLFLPDSNLVLIAIEKKFTDCFSLSIPSLPPRKLSSALLRNLTSFCWWFVKILLSNQVRREMGHRRRSFLVADVVLIRSVFLPFRNYFHPPPNLTTYRCEQLLVLSLMSL